MNPPCRRPSRSGSNMTPRCRLVLKVLGAGARLGTAESQATAVVLPGGFLNRDYLRCGVIARFAPISEAVRAFAAGGTFVLGICNGFHILLEARRPPGASRPNASLSFVCR